MKIPFENAPFYHYLLEILAFFIGMRFYFYLKKRIPLYQMRIDFGYY